MRQAQPFGIRPDEIRIGRRTRAAERNGCHGRRIPEVGDREREFLSEEPPEAEHRGRIQVGEVARLTGQTRADDVHIVPFGVFCRPEFFDGVENFIVCPIFADAAVNRGEPVLRHIAFALPIRGEVADEVRPQRRVIGSILTRVVLPLHPEEGDDLCINVAFPEQSHAFVHAGEQVSIQAVFREGFLPEIGE